MVEHPSISVVIPAHNAGRDIDACIRAIRNSRLPDRGIEVIVVDDASSDDTNALALSLADLVVQTGASARGPAAARNIGASRARAEFIAFVDADITVHADALALMHERLAENEQLVAVFGSYDDDPADPSIPSRYRNLLHHFAHGESAGKVATFWAGCGMVRKSDFDAVGGFDERRYPRPQIEDVELGYRLGMRGDILLDPNVLCKHLKTWTVWSIARTDFRDRAIPWVQLLLERSRNSGPAAPSLGFRAMVATGAAGITVPLIVAGIVTRHVLPWLLALGAIAIVIASSSRFYALLARKGGVMLTLGGACLHYIYLLESALAIPVGALKAAFARGSGVSSVEPVPRARFLPLAFGESGARVVAFIATAYLARVLGASAFGQIGFAVALVSHFGIALSSGIGEVGARDVARNPADASGIAAAVITLRLLVGAIAIVLIVVLASALDIDGTTRLITWLYAFTIVPLAIDTSWVYKGLARNGRVAIALLIAQGFFLAVVLAFVHSPSDAAAVPLIQVAGDSLAALLLLVPLLSSYFRLPSRRSIIDVARRSRMITLSRVFRTVVVSFDIVLLGLMVAPRDVGLYSAAYRIVFFVMAIIYASHVAFIPDVARSSSDAPSLSAILSRAIGLAVTVTIPFVVGGILIARPLIDLVFGVPYRDGALALQILLFSLFLFAIHGATRSLFIAVEKLGVETMIVMFGVIANIAFNLFLIPRFGIAGSATANVIGEGVILIGIVVVLSRLGVRLDLRNSFPAVGAGLVMAMVLLAIGVARPAWESIAVGSIAYLASLGGFQLLVRPGAVPVAEGVR